MLLQNVALDKAGRIHWIICLNPEPASKLTPNRAIFCNCNQPMLKYRDNDPERRN